MPRHRREGVHARRPRGSAACQSWDGWRTPPAPHVHVTAVWRLDLGTQRLLRHGRVRELTALQFRLLAHFVRNPGVTHSRRELLDAVWGDEFRGTERVVDQAICELRHLFEPDPAHPRYLRTQRGEGYWYRPPRPRPRGPSRTPPMDDPDDLEDCRVSKT